MNPTALLFVRHVCTHVCQYIVGERIIAGDNLRHVRKLLTEIPCPSCKLAAIERESRRREAERVTCPAWEGELLYSEDDEQT